MQTFGVIFLLSSDKYLGVFSYGMVPPLVVIPPWWIGPIVYNFFLFPKQLFVPGTKQKVNI